jgi:phenylalanyl-tRNA synthetase beta chain
MKIPLTWLGEWVGPPRDADPAGATDPESVAQLLTMGGLEVEDLAPAAQFTQVVVAKVLTVERHPNADRLSVCQVDTGGPAPRTVVCGAPNVAAGLTVPCALPGALLPGDFAIKSSTVRGVRSDGMLCSAKELGLSEDSAGLLVLDAAASPGTDLRSHLGLDEAIFEIKTTPNRGDCLSILGVAREWAALGDRPLSAPVLHAVPVNSTDRVPVRIDAPDLCGRFTGRVLRGLDARAPTPAWMKRRLEQCGQRSISALVDISNFAMLEMGQPSHVFDLQRLRGGLQVRWARPGERITLLNEQTVDLDGAIGVVADDSGAEAIAGIMGGAASAVSLETTEVYLESAFWWPEAIQGRARRFNFSTEAAHRFERGVDFAGTLRALERLTQLIVQICGTTATRVGPIDDTVVRLPERAPVEMRLARLRRVLGMDLAATDVRACFERLGLAWQQADDVFRVVPPSYRFDLQREEDLIEEVARVHGYDRIPADAPRAPARMRVRAEGRRDAHDLRRALAADGYQELINFSFVPESWESDYGADPQRVIRVLNPIASQHAVMRSNLASGLVANLRYNRNRQATRVRTFELGRVFRRDPDRAEDAQAPAGVAQPRRLAALAYGAAEPEQWGVASRPVDFYDLKGDLERLLHPLVPGFSPPSKEPAPGDLAVALHPGRSAIVHLAGRAIGWVGELHPRLADAAELPSAPVLFEIEVEPLLEVGLPQVEAVPRFPSLARDIAVWIDHAVPAGAVLEDLRALADARADLAAVRKVDLFDVFRPVAQNPAESPSGLLIKEKSLAFRVVLQDTRRSLTDLDADAARGAIVEHLLQRWGARVRQ